MNSSKPHLSLSSRSSQLDARGVLEGKELKGLVFALLLVHSLLLAWGSWVHSPAMDEVAHLPAGISHWQFNSFDLYRVNPPLPRMVAALPVLAAKPKTEWRTWPHPYFGRAEFLIGSKFVEANGPRSFWLFTIARWACIPFSILGGLVCFQWAKELNGSLAALMALTLWCFCPNIVGNAQMITPDTSAAAFGVAAAYVFWHWLKDQTWLGAFLAGFVFGLAQLTKTTWIMLFALWPLEWMIWKLAARQYLSTKTWLRQAGQLGLILFLGLELINLGYMFEGSFTKLGDYFFISQALGGTRDETSPLPMDHNRFKRSWLGSVPVPLPSNYLLGIDQQKADFENRMMSYLGGEWRRGGWWYYYLYGLAIKVPLGTWLLVFLAAVVTLWSRDGSTAWRDELCLVAPIIIILFLVSSQTGFNHHLRYVLPIFPFGFIWISKVASPILLKSWKWAVLVGGALAWSIISSLSVYPHSLSYFNELVGGPKGGPNHMVDSNIDWGQDLLFLKKWLDEHPEARPLGLVYFGFFDPRLAGIQFSLPPGTPVFDENPGETAIDVSGPRSGWYAISVTILKGNKYRIPDGKGGSVYIDKPYYTYFQRFEPVAMAGYSIYIYHVTLDDANRVRRELGLPELTGEEARDKP